MSGIRTIIIVLSLATCVLSAAFKGAKVVRQHDGSDIIVVPLLRAASGLAPDEDFHGINQLTLIAIGDPKQSVAVAMDTSTTDNWVFSSKCADKGCAKHAKYDSSKSKDAKAIDGKYSVAYNNGRLEGSLVEDKILFATFEAKNQKIAVIDKVPEGVFDDVQFDGVIGLGLPGNSRTGTTSIMQQLVDQEVISDSQFSLYVDQDGNPTMSIGGFAYYAADGTIRLSELTDKNQWMFKLDSMDLGSTHACKEGCNALIDTKSRFIMGPANDIETLNGIIGAKSIGNGRYELPNCDMSKLPDLVFWIEDLGYTLKPTDYVLQSSKTKKCYSALATSSKPLDHWVLGTTFVGPIMVSFDYDARQIGFANVLKE